MAEFHSASSDWTPPTGLPTQHAIMFVVKIPRAVWLLPVALLILASYLVPYLVLDDVDAWYGSLLFWTASAAVVIAINVVVSSAWRD